MSLILTGIGELFTGLASDEAAVHTGEALAVEDGLVAATGPASELERRYPGAERFDCGGRVVTPGLVDSHTHAIFGRWRSDEYALRCRGVPYMEIARRGGGINASVRDLRARSEEELLDLARPRLLAMLEHGTTTLEVKSGYGLTTDDELKMLRVARRLGQTLPLDVVPTFLGAHEIPPEYRDRREDYVELLVQEMIPRVAAEGLATFCDVFMEPGVFTGAEARRILEAGLEHGLVPKLHADELEASGGAELGVALGAASADHLGAVSDAGIAALAGSDTVATLLPGTLFFLGRSRYAPARRLLDAGATLALATDFNPGSSTNPNLQLVLTIACSQMGMAPLESLAAATAGGARALRFSDGRGTLRPGAPADLVVWNVDACVDIAYRYGTNRVGAIFKDGRRVEPRPGDGRPA